MGLQISIGISGQMELSRVLGVLASNIKDLRPAWDEIEKGMVKLQQSVFLSKGAYLGLPAWKKLADSTYRQKKKRYPQWADYPLIRTQRLMKAWGKSPTDDSVRVKEPLFFAYGIDEGRIPYATYHQLGKGHLPVREVLRIPEGLRVAITKVIQAHLVKTGQLVRGGPVLG